MENKWANLGVMLLIGIAIGHLFFVDYSVNFLLGTFIKIHPNPQIIDELKIANADWGVFGSNTLSRAYTGFSIWLSISLLAIAWINLLIFKNLEPGHILRYLTLKMGITVSILFTFLAAICWIIPPTVGGLLVLGSFVMGYRHESKLG